MDTIITNIGQLITPVESVPQRDKRSSKLKITHDAMLCIRNGRIVEDFSSHASPCIQTLDARGGVVMPGLIDPFWVMPRLPEWIQELPESKSPGRDLLSWSLRLLQLALRTGVTTAEVKCVHDSDFTGLAALGYLGQQRNPRVVGTLLATLPEAGSDRDCCMSSLIGEVIPEIRRRRLATFCDVGWSNHSGFVNEARTILRAASGAGLRPKLHLQEKPVMDNVQDLALALDVAAIGCASHLSSVTTKSLFEHNVLPVYLPALLGGSTKRRDGVRALLDQGIAIAIGSGNGLVESAPKSMWSVLASAIDGMGMTLSEAIVASTLHNAMAVELSQDVGSLEPGKLADLVVLDLLDYRELEAVIAAPPVSMVIVDGKVVHSS